MITGNQISKELCEALGLPKHTRGFTLRAYTGEMVTVECEYYPEGTFQTALAQYSLVPRELQQDRASTSVEAFGYDAWLADRTKQAHSEYMARMSLLPLLPLWRS